MTAEKLNKILENHLHWRYEDCAGWQTMRGDLSWTNLSWADLSRANLRWVNLCGANLRGANLKWADLRETDFSMANLKQADLRGANLSWAGLNKANLKQADLSRANLSWADLRGADLSGADLRDADLRDAKLDEANLSRTKNLDFPIACPDTGSFIAWKRLTGNKIAKLRIPEDAERSSATSRKCRASKAEVLEIQDLEGKNLWMGSVSSKHDFGFKYTAGETVYPDSWDSNRWNECGHGIHFFITRQEAVDYT